MRSIKQRRPLTKIGNSVGVTVDIEEARAREFVDENDEPRDDVAFEMREMDDGRFALVEADE